MSIREENISAKKIYDEFKRLGNWNLPNNKDKPIPGIIIYDKGKIRLETMTSLEKPNEDQFFSNSNLRKHEIIFGKLDTGETIILTNCVWFGHYNQRNMYTVSQMYVNNTFNESTLMFNKVSVEYSSLFNWLGINTIHVDFDSDQHVITHTKPKPITVKINNKFELTFFIGYTISSSYLPNDYTIPQVATVTVSYDHPMAFNDIYEKLKYFKYFLMMSTGHRIFPISINAHVTKEHLQPVFLNQILNEDVKNVEHFDMILTYQNIKNNFDSIMKSWYEICSKFDKSTELFFTTLQNEKFMLIDIVFLQMVQTLEAFHREKFKKDDELKLRLNELITPFSSSFANFDTERISKTRHYHSHGFLENYSMNDIITENIELIFVTRRLKLLMQTCLLEELPIEQSLKEEILKKQVKIIDDEESLNRQINSGT